MARSKRMPTFGDLLDSATPDSPLGRKLAKLAREFAQGSLALMDEVERRTYAATVAELVSRKGSLGFAAFADEGIVAHAPLIVSAILTRYANACVAAAAGCAEGAAEVEALRWFQELHATPPPRVN